MKHFLCCGNNYSNYETSLDSINKYTCVTLRLFLEAIYKYEPGLIDIILLFMNNNKENNKETGNDYKNAINTMNENCFVVKIERYFNENSINIEHIIMRKSVCVDDTYYVGLKIDKYKNNISSYIHRLINNNDLDYWCRKKSVINWYKLDFKHFRLYCFKNNNNILSNENVYYAKIVCISPLINTYHSHKIYKATTIFNTKLDLNKDEHHFNEIDHTMMKYIVGNSSMSRNVWMGQNEENRYYNYYPIKKYLLLKKSENKTDDNNKKQKIIRVKGFYDEAIKGTEIIKQFFCFPECSCSYYNKKLKFKL